VALLLRADVLVRDLKLGREWKRKSCLKSDRVERYTGRVEIKLEGTYEGWMKIIKKVESRTGGGGSRGQEAGKRYQIHAITSTADETNIANIVKRNKFRKINRLMHIMNWHELNTAELTIYTAYQFIDCCPEILVFFHVASRGDSDLDKDDLLLTLQYERKDR